MNDIKIFGNPAFGEVRVVMSESNEPMFCLSDVCKALDIKNPSDCKTRLRGGGVVTTEGSIQNQFGGEHKVSLTFIDEPNLYRCVFMSRKKEAEQFQDWVCEEVLPSIRKDGGYMIAKEDESEDDLMARALLVAQNTIKRKQERIKELEETNTRKTTLLEEQKPKVTFANAIVGSKTSILIGELAKLVSQNGIKIGQNRLFEWMRNKGFLGTTREYYNIPNQRYVEQGLFELKKGIRTGQDGVLVETTTTKVTGKGQEYFINGFLTGKFNIA